MQRDEPLVDRLRLAGERGFVDLERGQFDQAQVGRHDVAGLEFNQVAGHQLRRVNQRGVSVADDARLRAGHFLQGRHRALGAVFLDETDDAVKEHDDHDGDGVLWLADETCDHRRGDQHQDHEVGELRREHGERVAAAGLVQDVGAYPAKSRFGGFGSQSHVQVAVEMCGDRLAVEAMPVPDRFAAISRHANRGRVCSTDK